MRALYFPERLPEAMCDTMVVVRPGSVLFAKNSDRDANEAQFLDWHPRASHPAGTRLRCTWIEIEQVRETSAVLLSRPFWMWGAEIGANEHGVVIGNEAVFTDQPYAKSGLTGMDLLRLALERAGSAADAVAVITALLEQHGQGGGCGHERRGFTYHNSFIVADPGCAYVLETAGKLWVAEKVGNGARTISNGLTIEPFARQHGDHLKTAVSRCRIRQSLTQGRASSATGAGDLMTALADHGAGAGIPRYSVISGGASAPCMHAGGLAANSQTTASWVADLRTDGAAHWVTATASPCTSLFKPVRVTSPVELGAEPSDRYDPAALWWRHEELHRMVMRDPAVTYPLFRPERDAVQARWLTAPPDPAAAFAEADELLARWTAAVAAAVGGHDTRPAWARRYWQKRNMRAGLPARADVRTRAMAHERRAQEGFR
ncbi:MAG TPA: C69 family dipeptidase [Streptosporangiaceae bacterium]